MTERGYELRTAGYTVIPGVIPVGEVAELVRRMDELLVEDDAAWGADRLRRIKQRGALRNLADRGEVFERLLATPALHCLAHALLGADYLLHSYDGLVLAPDEGRFPWDFHTDLMPLRGIAFPASSSPGLNCLVAVDASGPYNGATWVVPASHRALVRDPKPDELARLAEQPHLDSGDLLLFDARLWHCAGHNASRLPRRLIKILLVQPWLRPQMEYARAVRSDVQHRLAPALRRTLGSPPPASVAELWREAERRA